MDVCLLCVLSGGGLCNELITRPEGPTDCDPWSCVIKKPRERGGHSPRCAAEPEEIIIIIIIIIIINFTSLRVSCFCPCYLYLCFDNKKRYFLQC
jgi:hypothetical protein